VEHNAAHQRLVLTTELTASPCHHHLQIRSACGLWKHQHHDFTLLNNLSSKASNVQCKMSRVCTETQIQPIKLFRLHSVAYRIAQHGSPVYLTNWLKGNSCHFCWPQQLWSLVKSVLRHCWKCNKGMKIYTEYNLWTVMLHKNTTIISS